MCHRLAVLLSWLTQPWIPFLARAASLLLLIARSIWDPCGQGVGTGSPQRRAAGTGVGTESPTPATQCCQLPPLCPSVRKPRRAPCGDLAGLVALSPGAWPAPGFLGWLQSCLECLSVCRHRCSVRKWGDMSSAPGTALPVFSSRVPAAGVVKLGAFSG